MFVEFDGKHLSYTQVFICSTSQKDKRTMKPKIWMYKDKETGNMKGEATVTYEDANAAQSAIGWFDNKEFNGSVVKVSLAQRYNTWQNKGGSRGGFNKGGFGGRKSLSS